jgi:uncharacterized protein (DUF1330 family)
MTHSIEIDHEELDAVIAAFAPDQPVSVVNLIRYLPEADYQGTHIELPPVSGERAYFERYLPAFTTAVDRFGGCELAFGGKIFGAIVGPHDEQWDAIIIGTYVSITAFRDLIEDPEYVRSAKPHRSAALAACRAYVTGSIS